MPQSIAVASPTRRRPTRWSCMPGTWLSRTGDGRSCSSADADPVAAAVAPVQATPATQAGPPGGRGARDRRHRPGAVHRRPARRATPGAAVAGGVGDESVVGGLRAEAGRAPAGLPEGTLETLLGLPLAIARDGGWPHLA